MLKLLFFFRFVLLSTSLIAQKDSSLIVFKHANLIDGISDKPLKNVTVTIENGKITGINKGSSKPGRNAIVIDLAGKWLLPGYIDANVYLSSFEAAQRAMRLGVTTARNMHCGHFIDIAIRDAHKLGRTDLPDMVAAGYQISPNMGEEFFQDFPELTDLTPKLTGVENVRRVVQALVTKKVDLIRIMATERANLPESDPQKRTLTDEEIKAIVDEAKKTGLYVAAHAHGDEGGAAAVRAGVWSIEHGTYLSDQTLRLMKIQGTYFVTNVATKKVTIRLDSTYAPESRDNAVLIERRRAMRLLAKEVTLRAYEIGLPIVCATNSIYLSDKLLKVTETAEGFVEIGLPSMEALKSITSRAAKCLKINNRTGAIKEGLEADLVIISQNPLTNIAALQDVLMVVNNGKVVINRFDTNTIQEIVPAFR